MVLLHTSCIDCIDVQNPVQRSVLRQRRWAEADAEFLKWMKTNASTQSSSSAICDKPEIYGGFASRQKYLRSYTFSKRKSATKKAKGWVLFKEKAGSDKAGEKMEKAPVASSSSSDQRPCSVLEAVLSFLFMCMVKVEVDQDPVH